MKWLVIVGAFGWLSGVLGWMVHCILVLDLRWDGETTGFTERLTCGVLGLEIFILLVSVTVLAQIRSH